jgi:hypothetical protein
MMIRAPTLEASMAAPRGGVATWPRHRPVMTHLGRAVPSPTAKGGWFRRHRACLPVAAVEQVSDELATAPHRLSGHNGVLLRAASASGVNAASVIDLVSQWRRLHGRG